MRPGPWEGLFRTSPAGFLITSAWAPCSYTSQPLYGPDDKDGTLLLKPGQEGYTVVGQLYGRVKLIEDNFINIYRYEYNTPYINKNDNRMTPNTFEGYTFTGAYGGKDGAPGSLTAAVTSIRSRSVTPIASSRCPRRRGRGEDGEFSSGAARFPIKASRSGPSTTIRTTSSISSMRKAQVTQLR